MENNKITSVTRQMTIGILGGGQLARMLAIAAGRLGFATIILDPQPNCPAAQFANRQIVAAYDDNQALSELASCAKVVTYEFENIPTQSLTRIAAQTEIFPSANALEISQDRVTEKRFIRSLGLLTANFHPVSTHHDLKTAIKTIKAPAILKTRRFGYDGKGQSRLKDNDSITPQIEEILSAACILEEMIEFDCEISVIGARNRAGEIQTYDPARNHHIDGILSKSIVPCALSDRTIAQAKRQTATLLKALDYVGVIGVEFFVTADNKLLINEFAPRVHNSGHWSEAACLISQFEQHIRAITNLPLGQTNRHSDCEMVNLIGNEISHLPDLAARPDTLVHDYGKTEIRPGRKMGHYTTLTKRSD